MKKYWTQMEKEILTSAVVKHTKNERTMWRDIALLLPGRTANQCKYEYINRVSQMKNDSDQFVWTTVKIRVLFQYVEQYGKRWKFLRSHIYKN